jgi:hypothetical protein
MWAFQLDNGPDFTLCTGIKHRPVSASIPNAEGGFIDFSYTYIYYHSLGGCADNILISLG